MAKGYWVAVYRSIKNPAALQDYAKLAAPAIVTAVATTDLMVFLT